MQANGAFSALSGTAALVGSFAAEQPLGLEAWFLGALGGGLIVYGLQLVMWSRNERLIGIGSRIATVADGLWVVGAVVALAFYPTTLDTWGRMLLAALTMVVAEFAWLQYIGLRRLAPAETIAVG
jgi:hypothetical protein